MLHERLDRFLGFDPDTGVVECEAGASVADLMEVFLPLGYFPPVTPGTKYVTIGGAIAADVHGKNHHRDGSFSEFLLDLRLLTASGETLRCSRTENADAFWATVGGMGLTGAILIGPDQAAARRVRLPRASSTARRPTSTRRWSSSPPATPPRATPSPGSTAWRRASHWAARC